jgi:hypothetical protein
MKMCQRYTFFCTLDSPLALRSDVMQFPEYPYVENISQTLYSKENCLLIVFAEVNLSLIETMIKEEITKNREKNFFHETS